MKFHADPQAFAEALQFVTKFLSARPADPLKAGVHISADSNGHIVITGEGQDSRARTTIEATVDEPGSVLVLGRQMADGVSVVRSNSIAVHTDERNLHFAAGRTKFSLPVMDTGAYMEPRFATRRLATLNLDDLHLIIKRVLPAASKDIALPQLTACNLVFSPDTLQAQATDRYHLAVLDVPLLDADIEENRQELVAGKVLQAISSSLRGTGNVEILVEPGMRALGFRFDGKEITTTPLEAAYPAVGRLFPDTSNYVARLSASDLLEATKRMTVFSADRTDSIKLTFTSEGLSISLRTIADGTHSSDELESQMLFDGAPLAQDEEFTIYFNAQYLIEGLAPLGASGLEMSMTAPRKAAVLKEILGDSAADGTVSDAFRQLVIPRTTSHGV